MTADHRPEPPVAAPPVAMTSAFLDFLRATLLWKVEGVSDADLRRPMVPSGVCLLGIVKHSAYVERWWFRSVFAGEDAQTGWNPDGDWQIEPDETTAAILTRYRDASERSRAIVAGAAWEDVARRPGRDQTLGWILTHMVEEVARHCGHADILRELIDGKTGQ